MRTICLCCVAWLALLSSAVRAEGAVPVGGPDASSSLAGALKVEGVLGSNEGEQVEAPEESKPISSEAVTRQKESRTKFENLGSEQASKVVGTAFPEVVNYPSGGPPALPAGQKILGFPSDNVAQVDLGGGEGGVIESTEPMAIETSAGQRAPIDLSLAAIGNVFEPKTPAVGVSIPKRLSDGVQLPVLDLSLTPVDAQGSPLGGSEGVVDGASVLYANTQTDSDTLVKPTTEGFEADTLLRSVESPERIYFRVGLPDGGSLVQAQDGDGLVKVMVEGWVFALIRPPSAKDAAGAPVPVSMSVKGDLLSLSVASHSAEYQWPIAVDPELASVTDSKIGESSNWSVHAELEERFKHAWSSSSVEQWNVAPNNAGEFTKAQYFTQGESKIYKIEAETAGNVSNGRAKLELAHEGVVENKVTLAENAGYGATNTTLCANAECSAAGGSKGNAAWYKLEAIEPVPFTNNVSGTLWNTHVYVAQEKAPEPTFNETEATIDGGRANVLYGTYHGTGEPQAWLSPTSGAFELKAHDPGIGVSWAQAVIGSWRQIEPIYAEGKCKGIQCNENYAVTFTYNPRMPDGEPTIEWDARNLAGNWLLNGEEIGLLGKNTQLIKVDATRPHNLEVSGWPASREISAAPHTLTFSATDGTAPTNSSGVKSISVAVDGATESSVPVVPCTLGPCTASGKWVLDAENLTEGVHKIVETATDNAGNVAQTEFTFDVRHASPVAIGPGTVDPTTGQVKLNATDVSLSGVGGVSRVYQSRNLTAGVEGPLGPQWAIGLGGGEGLTILPTGSAVLTGSAGGVTTFIRNSKGEFESPLGDSNLKVEAKEKEPGKGITEYLLIDAAAGTTTRFTQPPGTENTTPVYTDEFGAEAPQLNVPMADATDSSGNVWVADYSNNRIVKFSPSGNLIAAYGSRGSEAGQFINPRGIAINQSNGDVFVADEGNSRIEELSSSGVFIEAIGWGVSDGVAQEETCTSNCRAGLAGAGSGELREPKGLAIDSAGNVWVADFGNNRVQKFNAATGKYEQKFGTEGTGEGQFKNPTGIAFSGGNAYIVDYGNNRVQEVSTAGKFIAQFGKEGTGNGEFKLPRGIATDPLTGNLYVADTGNNRVQEFSAAGKLIAKFGSGGVGAGQFSEPRDVTVNSSGGIYVTDENNNRVEEWTRPSWLPTLAEGPVKSGTTTYAYEPVEEEGKTVIEPSEALAPPPAGVTCGTKPAELKKGCRALTFEYAKETTATGEGQSQWKDYKGHLKRVEFHAWDPSKAAMTKEVFVAQYAYDAKGRLRAEWDPRISPELKTTYGYDTEGHVTAVSRAGQQPWLLHYGAIAGDPNTGRLLSTTLPAASTKEELKTQSEEPAPVNTAAPTLSSTSPVIGTTMSVSGNGTWSNGALAYSYQWGDCTGSSCTPIPGATNQTYTPQVADAGYTLFAQVTATNGAGSTVASSAATSAVPITAPKYSVTFGTSGAGAGQMKEPISAAIDASGNVWVADTADNRIDKFTSAGSFIETIGFGVSNGESKLETCKTSCQAGIAGSGSGQFTDPWGITINRTAGDVYVTDQGNSRVEELTTAGSFVRAFGSPGTGPGQFGTEAGLELDPNGNVWVADYSNNRIEEFTATGSFLQAVGSAGSGNGQFSGPGGFAFVGGNMYVADFGNKRVQKFSLSGAYLGQFPSVGEPFDINENTVTGEIYETDTTGKVDEFNQAGTLVGSFGTKGTGSGQFERPQGIAVNASGDVFVVDGRNNRVEEWTPTYSTSNPLPTPPIVTSGAVSTIEYRVPLSPTGLASLSESEVAKWGQKDDPTEGMAIFPADEPMGWPAADYKRATIEYMDAEGRTVNTETPGNAIATSEYNETNDVVRTLSADNRAAALKEEAKSAEASKLLDTENTYNAEGTELNSTLGPEHKVKLASGSEVSARDHVKYSYDQGAPEGVHDGLVTETTDGAQYSGKEEDIRTTKTSFASPGWTLRKPTSVTTDPGGLNLTSMTKYEENTGNVIETSSPAASGGDAAVPLAYFSSFGLQGTAGGKFEGPLRDALDAHGDVWVTDGGNHRIEEFSSSGAFMMAVGWGVKDGKAEAETCTTTCQAGISGSGSAQFTAPWGIAVNQGSGNIYVSDRSLDRVEELSSTGAFVASFGSKGAGVAQFNLAEGIAIDSSGDVWVADQDNWRVDEYSSSGTFMMAVGWGVKDGKAEAETCTTVCQVGIAGSGNGQLDGGTAVAFSGGNAYVTDYGNKRVDEFSLSGTYISKFGSGGTGNGKFEGVYGIATDPISGDLYVGDSHLHRVQKFTPAGVFVSSFGAEGSGSGQFAGSGPLASPQGMVANSAGDLYIVDDSNNRVEEWAPTVTGNEGAHSIKRTYYTSGTEAKVAACQNHPEWANLPCQTEPAAQPGVSGLPELPVTTVTYNLWDEIETTTEKFGSTTRTKTQTYDAAGRAMTSEETSTVDTALPKVTNEYSSETGALIKQSATTAGVTKTITSVFNTLAQLESYTDADANTSTYKYDIDGRVEEVHDGKGSQIYAYDATTGFLTKLLDSTAGTFTASYDGEGKMLTETYPNGMTASYSLNPLGQATGLEYVKTTHCTENCTLFTDSVALSIHGETLAQTSTLVKDRLAYDKAGRLTKTEEEPTGKGCTTLLYGYDEEGNRASLTKREPGTEGKCATEGGNTEWHTYDTANRPTDAGVTYDTFGNTTKQPASDAGGNTLTSTYYVDNQVASQAQNEETIEYLYDPAGRTRETKSKGKTAAIVTSHYSGPSEALAWTSEEEGKQWTRNIPGIDGALDAIQSSSGTTTLQLHDLQGNIIGTIGLSETETKLLSTYNSTEFGVPQPGTTPPKYAWLGASGLATELSSGVTTMGGASYVPQVARDLQTAPVIPPGAFPNGTGTGSAYTSEIPGWSIELDKAESVATILEYAAKQEAARRKAEQEALETAERIESEENEDPCTTTTESGSEELFGATTMSASVTVAWCYSAKRVVSAHILTQKATAYNHWWWPEDFHFVRWAERAEWLGSTYFVQRVAEFYGEVPGTEYVFPLPIRTYFYIELDFELSPGGSVSTEVHTRKEA
jgi:YD repeat-containing protein